jgi:hypothetical protein
MSQKADISLPNGFGKRKLQQAVKMYRVFLEGKTEGAKYSGKSTEGTSFNYLTNVN